MPSKAGTIDLLQGGGNLASASMGQEFARRHGGSSGSRDGLRGSKGKIRRDLQKKSETRQDVYDLLTSGSRV